MINPNFKQSNMDLLVTVTLSDRLFGLLEDKLPNLGRRIEKAITKEIGAQTRKESSIDIAVDPRPQNTAGASADGTHAAPDKPKRPRQSKNAAPTADGGDTAAPEAMPLAENIPAAQPEKPAGERIREIMHRTRQRFEGEDYKENADSDAYKKYHRALTAQFKQIAIVLGYEKPSYIDDTEKIDAFAAECDALTVGDNGLILPPPAPY